MCAAGCGPPQACPWGPRGDIMGHMSSGHVLQPCGAGARPAVFVGRGLPGHVSAPVYPLVHKPRDSDGEGEST